MLNTIANDIDVVGFEEEVKLAENSYTSIVENKEKYKIIEFNGVYWHCSPRYYQGDEIIKRYFNGKPRIITVSDVWNKDKMKLDFFKSQGYDVLVVWEDDYYKDKNEVINKCMEFLYGND